MFNNNKSLHCRNFDNMLKLLLCWVVVVGFMSYSTTSMSTEDQEMGSTLCKLLKGEDVYNAYRLKDLSRCLGKVKRFGQNVSLKSQIGNVENVQFKACAIIVKQLIANVYFKIRHKT